MRVASQADCIIVPNHDYVEANAVDASGRAQLGQAAYEVVERADNYGPDISVLVSLWNDGVWLHDFIAAVLAQEDCTFELLIVNDASDDTTAEILAEVDDPRIRIFSNTTRRYWANAMNDLAEQSRGRLLKLVCADDLLQSTCLAQCVAFYQSHPDVGYIVSGYEMINDQGHVTQPFQSNSIPAVISATEADKMFMTMGCWFGTSMLCIPKSCWDEIGGLRDVTAYNPKQIPIAEDFDMAVRLNAKRAAGYINAPLMRIRAHEARTSTNATIPGLKVEANLRILKEVAARMGHASPSAGVTATAELLQQGAGNFNIGLYYIRTGHIHAGLKIIMAVLSVLSPYQIASVWTGRMMTRMSDRVRRRTHLAP